jgi:DNA polymerase-3 subunit delta'
MLLDTLIGQEVAKRVLRRAWSEDRLAQSYLFFGPGGVGKETAARDLALALNCEGGGERPCRACNPCRKTANYIHPDFHYLFPRPHPTSESDKRKLAEEITEMLKEKAAHPHRELDFGARPTAISIDDIRELQEKLEFQPYEGRRKVAVISGAEEMTTEAANAFLKVLEEPSPTTHFILVSDRPSALLPTILSRCQKVRFHPLPPGRLAEALLREDGQSREAAALLARLSGNSLGRARQMIDQDLLAERDLALNIMEAAASGRHMEMLQSLEKLGRDRGRCLRQLELMSSLASDLLQMRTGGRAANSDRQAELGRLGRMIPDGVLERVVAAIETSRAALEGNVTIKLCLLAVCNTIQGG